MLFHTGMQSLIRLSLQVGDTVADLVRLRRLQAMAAIEHFSEPLREPAPVALGRFQRRQRVEQAFDAVQHAVAQRRRVLHHASGQERTGVQNALFKSRR